MLIKSLKTFSLVLFAYASHSFAALYLESPIQKDLLTDGKMHLYLCGTGDPEVTMQEIRKPACLALIANKQFMLFDAGEGAIQTLASMGLPYPAIHNVFITHWHSDHFSGLGQVINATWNNGRNEPINIYGPYGVKQVVKGLAKAYQLDVIFRASNSHGRLDPQMGFGIPKLVDAVKHDKIVYDNSDIKIIAFPVSHEPVYPALGYVVHYKGCKIVISGDTKVTPTLAAQAKDANLLINEVLSNPLNQEIYQQAMTKGDRLDAAFSLETKNYHSDSLELAKMAQQANVKHLVLTHFVPAIPTTSEVTQAFVKGMSKYYTGPMTISADKDEITIESTGADNCHIQYKPAKQPVSEVHKIN
ncbi:MBL fold metallo-hydrolase [Fluoribacter gormanii]|uniref:Ribonuclease Z n=1 Tax=Fluoribacter gormanii TaxID=464 RepID=A0A377GHM3_9GAMM|nr:MBL fold metallo-hydrolase [Fluoribacter gormanii]KTD01312.1 metallo-beta-lactamase [Fluoribacter gormanii]MCW8444139.1 MBL fold metallo-hydrolase [Fluoribacter gormanii]SIR81484.1 ribonuclease Z [Fluoribacter gormanii]STO24297.1 Ribonuclease Z [Fluoribacter gormanii]